MSKQHYHISTYNAQNSVGYLTKRSHSLFLDVIEPIIAERGFSFVQYVILSWLRDGIAVTAKEFCAKYRHDTGAITRVIDQLVERGLIERTRGDKDRRKVDLSLTPQGRDLIESVIPAVIDKLNEVLADFSSEEVHELLRLLVKLNASLQTVIDRAARVEA